MNVISGQRRPPRLWAGFLIAGAVATLGLVLLLAVWLMTGGGSGIRQLPATAVSLIRAVGDHERITSYSKGQYTNVVFLHHSTGKNLIEEGGVRDLFAKEGYAFWDHGYNEQGLRDPAGVFTGYNYYVPRDNTDPDGFVQIFSQTAYDLPLNTFSGLLQHEVVIFKSCFAPANNITSDQQLTQYMNWYLGIRDVMSQHPDKLFIVVTSPPLNPAETTREEATRARRFADWLKSRDFLGSSQNISTFDLFGSLAEQDLSRPDANTLRQEYRTGGDSHPNRLANETLGPTFVDFVVNASAEFRRSGAQQAGSRQ